MMCLQQGRTSGNSSQTWSVYRGRGQQPTKQHF